MGISIGGLTSGLDTASIIDQLVGLEQSKVTKVETQKTAYQTKITAYAKLKSYLTTLQSKATALTTPAAFDVYKMTSSKDDTVAISGSTGAAAGRYDVKVFGLASMEKLISKDKLVDDQTRTLASYGITTGAIEIKGTSITVGASDTLQDLRMRINNAKDADGKSLGVMATVVKVADNNFRMILTANESGTAGITYKDIGASDVLQKLGFITNAAGDKGNIAQTLTSTNSVLSTLADGQVVEYTGKDHNGNTITNRFVKSASNTVADLLSQINNSFHGMAEATDDGSGRLVLTDNLTGTSQLALSSFKIDGVEESVVTVNGSLGSGVLNAGSNAYYSVDGIALASSKNSATGAIAGVTLDLKKTITDTAITVSIDRDLDGVQKKVNDMLDAYNNIRLFAADYSKRADPKVTASTTGALAGDMTLSTIVSQVQQVFRSSNLLVNTQNNSLATIGIKSDSKSGNLSIDSEKFKKMLTEDFDNVVQLFTTFGSSLDADVTMGRNTKDTTSGKYTVEEVDANFVRVQLEGDTNWYTSSIRSGDIVTFSSGPAKGLSLSLPTGALGGASTTFTFSKGFGAQIDELVGKLNDATDGMVALRQNTLQGMISSSNDRIERLNTQIDSYRNRLVKQFTNMEQMMSQLKNQTTNMLNQLR